jgi:hypothetical protein
MNSERSPKDSIDTPAPTPVAPPVNPAPASQPEAERQLADAETQIEQRMSAFERSSIRWTKGMFAVTLATGVFIAAQWWEIRTGSVDTHELAVAAGKQADAAKTQAEKMTNLSDQAASIARLQVQTARLAYGAAILSPTPWMQFGYKGDKMYAVIAVHVRDGKTTAESIQIAARIDVLESRPNKDDVGDFKLTTPSDLPPYDRNLHTWTPIIVKADPKHTEQVALFTINSKPESIHSNYGNRKVYVWGKIRYRDYFTGGWSPDVDFCRNDLPIRVIQSGPAGFVVQTDCDTKAENPNR